MTPDELIAYAIDFFYAHPPVAIGAVVLLCFLAYFRPKPLFRAAVILLVLGGIFYGLTLIGELTSTGVSQKKKMVEEIK